MEIRGIIAPVLTPFTRDGKVNERVGERAG